MYNDHDNDRSFPPRRNHFGRRLRGEKPDQLVRASNLGSALSPACSLEEQNPREVFPSHQQGRTLSLRCH